MTKETEKAASLLRSGNYTCVLIKDSSIYTSTERGVKPLLDIIIAGNQYDGCVAADKVIGKAAAFLYVLIGAREIYAGIISKAALAVLREHGIDVSCDLEVDAIRNRTNTGFCPMEQATSETSSLEEAFMIIKEKVYGA